MIPGQNIVEWSQTAPWAERRQVEQDLIISRALVEIFDDPVLASELRFRGGTALARLTVRGRKSVREGSWLARMLAKKPKMLVSVRSG